MTASVSVRRQKVRKNHTKKRLFFFLLLTALLMLVVIFAEQICPYDPNAQVFTTLEPPSAAHPAGTDRLGRDLLSRILVGLQTSVVSTLTLVVIITAAGTAVGVVCGHLGGVVDSLMMRVSDVCLAFPGLVFALAIAALLNGGLQNAIIALAVISWPKYARIARSQTLALESTDYIAAARLAGDTSAQIILRHILPNSAGPILVTAVLDIGTIIRGLLNPIVVRSFYKGSPRKIWTIKRPFALLPPCRKSCVFSPVPPHSTPPIGWSIGELT